MRERPGRRIRLVVDWRLDVCGADAADRVFDLVEFAGIREVHRRFGSPAPRRWREQVSDVHLEGAGEAGERIDADVHFPALDLPEVLAGVSDEFRELLLGEPARPPQALDVRP